MKKHITLLTSTRFGFIDLLSFEDDSYCFSGSVISVDNNHLGFYYNRDNTRMICFSQVSSLLYANSLVIETFNAYSQLWDEYKDLKKHIKRCFPQINNTPQEIDEELINMTEYAYELVTNARKVYERAYSICATLTQEFSDYGNRSNSGVNLNE